MQDKHPENDSKFKAARLVPESLEAIPEMYAKGQWTPVGYTTEEGGDWNLLGAESTLPLNYSAIQYRNGWIFDNVLRQLNLTPWRHADDTSTRIEVDGD